MMNQLFRGLITYFPVLLLLAVWVLFWRSRRTPQESRESVLREQVDNYQSRQRWMLLMSILAMLVLCLTLAFLHPSRPPNTFIAAWYVPSLFFPLSILSTLYVSLGTKFLDARYRMAIQDELGGSLRAKATKVGYAVTMAVLAGSYLIVLARPNWIEKALPLGVFVSFAVPALYLIWLELRTNSSE